MPFLSDREIAAYQPFAQPPPTSDRAAPLRQRLAALGLWTPRQIAGRRWPIGCVALEITQRCNLDCELCYLSEQSEAVRDLPLAEVFRRIDMIHAHYGPDTDVQVTGGDPTLRRKDELVAIVRRVRERGMRASLFTNGIRATRALLRDLSAAGLTDVAFHVDITQRRKGYPSEKALNVLRAEYVETARGLPLAVFFNTTVCAENLHEIPDVVGFFRTHADVVSLASFQLQADVGRGVRGERAASITQQTVIAQIERGAGTPLNFDAFNVGHQHCNKYAMAFAINGNLYDAYRDTEFVVPLLEASAHLRFDRTRRTAAAAAAIKAIARAKGLRRRALRWLARLAWSARRDLWAARGSVNKLTFFVHNFMDQCKLDPDRLQACVFMTATGEGPISMCVHNAKRDLFILEPIELDDGASWQPVRAPGPLASTPQSSYPLKYLKGRTRAQALAARSRRGERSEERS